MIFPFQESDKVKKGYFSQSLFNIATGCGRLEERGLKSDYNPLYLQAYFIAQVSLVGALATACTLTEAGVSIPMTTAATIMAALMPPQLYTATRSLAHDLKQKTVPVRQEISYRP